MISFTEMYQSLKTCCTFPVTSCEKENGIPLKSIKQIEFSSPDVFSLEIFNKYSASCCNIYTKTSKKDGAIWNCIWIRIYWVLMKLYTSLSFYAFFSFISVFLLTAYVAFNYDYIIFWSIFYFTFILSGKYLSPWRPENVPLQRPQDIP